MNGSAWNAADWFQAQSLSRRKGTPPVFNIKEDLKGRPLDQQIEILWISGPTWHNAKLIAHVLNLPVQRVLDGVKAIPKRRK